VLANAGRLQGLYMHAADLLEQRGLYAAEQVNVLWLVRVLRAIGGSLQDVLSFSIVTFVFVILGLLEVEPLGRRLCRIGNAGAIDTAAEIAVRLQTYMLVRLGMSVLTGLAFWVFTAVDGLELQREWGVIAFVLNFIPFIGSFVATLLPTLFAAAQFESLYARSSCSSASICSSSSSAATSSHVWRALQFRSPRSWFCLQYSFGVCSGGSPVPLSVCRS